MCFRQVVCERGREREKERERRIERRRKRGKQRTTHGVKKTTKNV